MRRIYVECDQNGVPVKNTYRPDRGDRPHRPNEYIHWAEEADLNGLPENGTDGVLLICLPNNRGPRRVPENAPPKLIQIPVDTRVKIGDELKLECR